MVDIAPRYSGTLYSFSNTLCAILSIEATIVAGVVLDNQKVGLLELSFSLEEEKTGGSYLTG